MLCACVNLHECSIAFPRSADPEISATIQAKLNALGVTVLPALSRLDIQFDFNNFSMPYLFDYLALPRLRFLSIKGPLKASMSALGNHLVKLQKRSGFSLEKLVLCCIGEQVFLTKHLVKLLWRQPKLQSLNLSECGFYLPDIIGPMHFHHNSSTPSPLLPQLEELIVVADGYYFVADDNDDPYYLSGAIASRWWTCESDKEEKREGEKTGLESVEQKLEQINENVGCFNQHSVAQIYRAFIYRNYGEFERTDRKNLHRCRADGLDLVVTDESRWNVDEEEDTEDGEDEKGAKEGTVKQDREVEEVQEE
ncbi:hypothetical protein VKT23_009618 [Stygiomarasmius scandens]|uniref:Uncharacterized protein n=1 Tax=Marasmiellus scandens TaxID=2682957 RepID=A0ABR1J1M7_9AGAR